MSAFNWPPARQFNEVEDAIYRYLLTGITDNDAIALQTVLMKDGGERLRAGVSEACEGVQSGYPSVVLDAALNSVDWDGLADMVTLALETRH